MIGSGPNLTGAQQRRHLARLEVEADAQHQADGYHHPDQGEVVVGSIWLKSVHEGEHQLPVAPSDGLAKLNQSWTLRLGPNPGR